MESIKVEQGINDKIIKDFIQLPSQLYKSECPQDRNTELNILNNKHVLSDTFEIMPFVAYKIDKNKEIVVARCIVTLYKEDEIGYIGFFECIDSRYVCSKLFEKVEDYIRSKNKTKIVGPVDSSFWIKYRFKHKSTLIFSETYTGEPYNKIYYTDLWRECGYNISDTYESNFYRLIEKDDMSEKLSNRLNMLNNKGYKIVKLKRRNFNKDIIKIYKLIKETYKNFPIYKDITQEQFVKLFKNLKYILNFSMVKLVYKDGNAVGFIINIPNYNTCNINNINILKLLKIRLKPKEYIIMYIGVKREHLGIGSALAEDTKRELYNKKCTSIGALVHKGKASGGYYKELIEHRTEYVILTKEI